MAWLLTGVGVGLVLLALADIFSTLWQPSGRGPVTRTVMSLVWRGLRRLSTPERLPTVLDRAGPVAMVAVILTWAVLVGVGCALVYGPHLPEQFSYSSDLERVDRSSTIDALYLSTVTMTTLGYGDITPDEGWWRLLVPLQALLGFVILTAAVSWVLQVYPALARRRVLALRLSVLSRALDGDPSRAASTSTRAQLLHDLAAGVSEIRVDLSQYAETYYYREGHLEAALPVALRFALELAGAACRAEPEEVRVAGATLSVAIGDLCLLLREDFGLHGDEDDDVLDAFAEDHRHHPAALS